MDTKLIENQKVTNVPITLTPEQSQKFRIAIKIGLYKELHRKGLLTDTQLKQLMNMQNK